MNWKARIALIVTAAIALYAVLAWTLSRNTVTTPKLAARITALEAGQGAGSKSPLGENLHALLRSQPEGGTDLLGGMSREAVVGFLGWPDQFNATHWWYAPNAGQRQVMEIEWTVGHTVFQIQWLDRIPDGK